MEMTEYEIVKMYEQARYPQKQIYILAQLNLVSPYKIACILKKHGENINTTKYKSKPSKESKGTKRAKQEEIDMIINLRKQGHTFKYIGDLFGRSRRGISIICNQYLGPTKKTPLTAPTVFKGGDDVART